MDHGPTLAASIPQTAWRRLSDFERRVIIEVGAWSMDDAEIHRGIHKAVLTDIARRLDCKVLDVREALSRAHTRRVLDVALVGNGCSVIVVAARRGSGASAFDEAARMLERGHAA